MKKIEILAEILSSVQTLHLWTYDRNGNLLSTTSSFDEDLGLDMFDRHSIQIRETACHHAKPSIIASVFDTSWIVSSHRENDEPDMIYVLGPFYIDSFSENSLRDEVYSLNLSLNRKQKLFSLLKRLPVISFMKVIDYTIMMHYAINDEKITPSDLHVREVHIDVSGQDDEQTRFHGTYKEEQEMLRMVREGDLRFVDYLKELSSNINVGKLANDDSDSLRQMKNMILVATTLFSRAAIEGGLYPDTAMTLTDRYFQSVEAATSFQEVAGINMTMQMDFVNRVHKIKTSNGYSKAVRTTIEYIELHKEDDISLKDIARSLGYTDYYLSRKFRSEVGSTFKEYVRDVRLEHARFLLKNETIPSREISDRLHFSSQSYFSECFKEKYHMTPNEYRLSDRN